MKIEALTKISYGLFVVSTISDNKKNGYISNTVMQISNDPLIVAASCSKNNHSLGMIESSGIFSVSILHQDANPELIGNFGFQSGKDTDKFSNINYKTGKTGAPVVTDDAIAYFDCEIIDKIDASTHYLFIARVVDADILDGSKAPMTYQHYREVKKGVIPQNSPTYIKEKEEKEKQESSSSNENPKYQCAVCGYIYDPAEGDKDNGVEAGTPFTDLPDGWACPVCGAEKENFYQL